MRIAATFERLRARRELALLPYLPAGFPTQGEFANALRDVARAGADLIEIGIPFSDPIADGPTIQRASQIALAGGAGIESALEAVESARLPQPIVFMSYLNPLLAFGRDRLLARMSSAGVDGLIVPDLPVEESDDWLEASRRGGRELIFLAAPTSTDARLAAIGARSGGFVYAVSVLGTTGARAALSDGLGAFLSRVRAAARAPVAVGFGISTPEQIRALRGLADGVVVGSRLVDAISSGEDLSALVATLKAATREGG